MPNQPRHSARPPAPRPIPQAQRPQFFAQAQALLNQRQYQQAERLLLDLVAVERKNPQLLHTLGVCQIHKGDLQAARATLERAVKLAPTLPRPYCELSLTYTLQGDYKTARELLERARGMAPKDAVVLHALADVLCMTGENQSAYDILAPFKNNAQKDINLALAFAKACERTRRPDEGIAALAPHRDNQSLNLQGRISSLYQLGRLYDLAGNYDDAYSAFTDANQLEQSDYNPDQQSTIIDMLIKNWTRDALAASPCAQQNSELPVFIVGMPRSGTSLVEQIVASHPQAFGAGELPLMLHLTQPLLPQHLAHYAFAHVESPVKITQSWLDQASPAGVEALQRLDPAATRITDKSPQNFLQLGVISRLFPGARIIHCQRDPLDTCLSCFFQQFRDGPPYTHDLSHCANYHRDCDRLMQHWKSVLDVPMLDVVYEELVADQDAQSRRLIEFLGLDWSNACLRFYETDRVTQTASNDQVRRPMYASSVKRHERYAKHLGPMRRTFAR